MLSVFPYLLSLSFLGIFVLRAGLGVFSLIDAVGSFRKQMNVNKIDAGASVLQFIVSIFIIVGYLTQPMAIALAVIFLVRFFVNLKSHNLYQGMFYLFLALTSLVILTLGPGPFAFDLPL